MRQIVVTDDVMAKVISKEKNAARLNRCLAAKICPKCGEGIDCEVFNDGGHGYECIDCDFSLLV